MNPIKQVLSARPVATLLVAMAAISGGILLGLVFMTIREPDLEAQSGGWDSGENPYHTTALFVSEPSDVDNFVNAVDAIVVAQVASVIREGSLNSYNAADNTRNVKDGDPYPSAIPITDYSLTIEQVILGEDLEVGGSVTLRMTGHASLLVGHGSLLKMPELDDRRIYGLGLNPDGTYGLFGWWSQFNMEGNRVTHADELRKQVSFVDTEDPTQFIEELKSAVARQ